MTHARLTHAERRGTILVGGWSAPALLIAPQEVRADEGGISWFPGLFASLAAVPGTPGWSS
jgi:hypothetical protein